MTKPHYYVSGVVMTFGGMKNHQIMEEKDGKQVCIAVCPYIENRRNAWENARRDALMLVDALNFYMENKNAYSPTP